MALAVQRSLYQAEAGEACPAPSQGLRPRAPVLRPRMPALCYLPQFCGPDAVWAEFLHASPIRGQFLCLLSPPTTPLPLKHASQGLAAGQAQMLFPAPKGPVASGEPEPLTCPWEGWSGLGIHSPSPATSHPAVGKGHLPPFQAPSQRRGWAHPLLQHPPKAKERSARLASQDWCFRLPTLASPHQASLVVPAPLSRPATGPGGEERRKEAAGVSLPGSAGLPEVLPPPVLSCPALPVGPHL